MGSDRPVAGEGCEAGVDQLDGHIIRKLVAEHAAALALYARQWCHSPDDAVQEAFVELVRLERLPENPAAWLFRAVRWRAMNLARSEHRRAQHQRRCSQEQLSWFIDTSPTAIDAQEAERMLEQIDELDREIVVARIWGELSFEQIAELVDVPTSSVHRRYGRALKRLAALLQGEVRQVSPSHE